MAMKQALAADAGMKLQQKHKAKLSRRIFKHRYLFLMLAPALVCLVLFNYVPLSGWIMAFKNYNLGMSIWKADWIGLHKFELFFVGNSDFAYIIRNTLCMNMLSILLNTFASLGFSLLLKELVSKRFSKVMQSVTLFPFFISWITVYSLANSLFAVESGAINVTLVRMGILKEGINVLGDPNYSWGLMILLSAWKYIGYNSIIFIAAMSGISDEQYEAADIDGAGRFKKILYITIPGLLPTVSVLLIMNSGWILSSSMDQFYVFTNATNWDKMEVFDMYVYHYGLQLNDYSYATAVGIVKTIASLAVLFTVNGLSRKLIDKSIF